MSKISEIDLGSALLSIFILIGFIGTAFAFVRLAIIGINYIKVNFPHEDHNKKSNQSKRNREGF